MKWLDRHAQALQALGALLTALFALAALIGVKLQLDTSERISREAQARDIYRSYLALSIEQPRLAAPGACPIFSVAEWTAYDAYVEYLLYTAEQVTDMDPDWTPTFENALSAHLHYLCAGTDWAGYTPEVDALITRMRATQCAARPVCD